MLQTKYKKSWNDLWCQLVLTLMHIAFVSFEYPPDTADGGIATYVPQATWMLLARGHTLAVFAASRTRTQTESAWP